MTEQHLGDWQAAAAAELPDVVALRRAIHADPELGLHCPRTAGRVKAALAGLPLEIREGERTTGFVAILRGGRGGSGDNGRTVLLRGDHDALPMSEETGLDFASTVEGAMHACGHDVHTAMLVGAAKALCARREELPGTVVFMFQPGEEGHHGAREMIADGLLADPAPEAAFALHILPNLPVGAVAGRAGPLLASTDSLHLVVRGRGGHAAMPHDARDPIPAACAIVLALQSAVAREIPIADPAVLSITQFHAGSSHNIIPDEVRLMGTLRTLSERTREQARALFRRTAEGIAAGLGVEARVELEEGYPVTRCDPRAVALMQDCVEAQGDSWMTMPSPMMGGEDFAYVLRETPGAMVFLGAAPEGVDPATAPPLHNTRMAVNEEAIAHGIALHCAVATRFLGQGFDPAA